MAEPTAVLTASDLLIEAALEMGVAYYGAGGDEAPQVPTNAHDLSECYRHVNKAIRMFISHGPAAGWRWRRPTASVILWPSVAVDATVTVTGGAFAGGVTTITATAASFYPSMERKTITITSVGDFTISSYTSSTVIVVTGDASSASADTFSITADGNYTLPQSFGGQYSGDITYAAETNQGQRLGWGDEGTIRRLREDDDYTDYPSLAAVRIMDGTVGRRWELVVWPTPSAVVTVQFPYDLYFDSLDATTDVAPCPYSMDEGIRAAVRYVVERDIHRDANGPGREYYFNVALPAMLAEDARSAPKRLGKMVNPSHPVINQWNYRDFRGQPAVDTSSL